MKGSEKQITWANEIRSAFVAKIEAGREKIQELANKNPNEAIRKDIMDTFDRLVNWEYENASEWIENKSDIAISVYNKANKSGDVKLVKIIDAMINMKLI
jgi:hypothetical protein